MNRKEAERLSEKWLGSQDGLMEDVNSLANLLLRTYKKGVKEGATEAINHMMGAVNSPFRKKS